VAVFERVILAVPMHIACAHRDHRAPRSLRALRVSWTEAYRCKSSSSHQNSAYHHLSTSMQGLVLTPKRLSLFQYSVAAGAFGFLILIQVLDGPDPIKRVLISHTTGEQSRRDSRQG